MNRPRRPRPSVPRWLRPKLSHDQVLDLALASIENLDAIARGEGTDELLHDWAGAVLTFSRIAAALGRGEPEMVDQLDLVNAVVSRRRFTGRIGFTGPEYQLAKRGLDVMDQLARIVDRPTAIAAAEWSDRRLDAVLPPSPSPSA